MRHSAVTGRGGVDPTEWAIGALIVALSLAECGLIYWMRAAYLPGLVDAVRGIVQGTPAWEVFQSRVLGPYLMQLVAAATGDFTVAYLLVMGAAIVVKDLATFLALRRFKGTAGAILPTLAGMALFVLLQDSWIYPWDPIDGAVSAAIIYAAADGFGWSLLAWAYSIALFNRESSLYVGLHVAIEALLRPARCAVLPFGLGLASSRRLVAAVAMMAGSLAVTAFLRRILLIREAETGTGAGASWAQFGPERPAWRYNIELLHRVFVADRNPLEIAALLAVLVALALILLRLWSNDFRLRKLALLALVEFGATLVFAVILELRVFSGLLPFLVLFAFSGDDERLRRRAPVA